VLTLGPIGHYRALEYSVEEKKYLLNSGIGVEVDVRVRGITSAHCLLALLSPCILISGLL
jgi:hypothetical protein